MDRKQIALKLTFDALKLDFEVDNFRKRLILQKTAYLAQAADVHLGYHFSWYLRGPYCSALTSDAFDVASEIASETDESQNWQLDDSSLAILEDMKPLWGESDQGKLARDLELLASVHFLLDKDRASRDNPKDVVSTLERFGKNFSEEEVKEAIEELEEYAII